MNFRHARMALDPGWDSVCGLVDLLERFKGSTDWDDTGTMMAAYERHNAQVRNIVSQDRLLQWHVGEGWAPICQALYLAVPDRSFPWVNHRSEWLQ